MEIVEYLVVIGLSAFKVLVGVASAVTFDMDFIEVFLSVAIGGILGVSIYAFLGNEIRDWLQRRKRANGILSPTAKQIKRLRFVVKIWKRFGIIGVAILTPPFLTPPVGTAIALAFGERVPKIIIYLGVSMIAWSLLFALLGNGISQMMHPTA